MDIRVKQVKLAGHLIETPAQDIYQRYPCPICGNERRLQPIAEVHANSQTSLESAFCLDCEHRFHRKFPKTKWLQDYYREKFESSRGTAEEIPPIRPRGFYRRVRTAAGRLLRYGLSQSVPNRIHDFLFGLTKADGWYYRRHPAVKKILEIGCGRGDNLLYFDERDFETYGTESNPLRVAECRGKGLRVFPSSIDGFESVNASAPYDFIFSSHVLEHVIDVDSHIRDIAAMLRPDGFLYVETPDLSGESLVQQTHTIFHVQTFSLASMLRLLAKHGFEAVRIAADGNIQVLARKSESGAKQLSLLSGRVYRDVSAPYLACLARHAPEEFRLRWDHYRMTIERASDSTVLYDTGLRALAVAPGPNRHEMLCQVAKESAGELTWPIRFHYDQPAPPLWYKI
ncbi:MAG TPA: class I SAM-dependent methyltransferase [Burkholderiales bacterium]|nr:class I SAM-dependent methyltransferase [Burkholderiales bacterium]